MKNSKICKYTGVIWLTDVVIATDTSVLRQCKIWFEGTTLCCLYLPGKAEKLT